MRDDELLRRYLLEPLPEEDLQALERRLLQDEDLSDLAESIEGEILEEYARGELSPGERRRVADYLRSSSSGRVRLSVIQGLSTLAAEAAEKIPGNGRVLPFPALSRRTSRFAAIAAMLVMMLGGFWAIGQRAVPGPGKAVVLQAVVLALDLGSVRGEDEIPELAVPRNAGQVELRLELARGDGSYSSYRVALLDETGADVLRLEDLRPTRFGEELALALSLEASRLRAGRYVVEVRGVTAQGHVEDLAFREFQLLRS